MVFAAEMVDNTELWAYETYGSGVALTSYKGDQTDVYIPNKIEAEGESLSVIKVGDGLFDGATINSATLGEGITEIGDSAFANNANLVCIVTPESLTTIGNDGMGFTVITIKDGKIYGETDITVLKYSHIAVHEELMKKIPLCKDREEALTYIDGIRSEKEFYDGLSKNEKKQLSKEYVDKLNHNAELISGYTCQTNEGIVENGGLIVSEDELDGSKTVELVLNVEKKDAHTKSEDGVKTSDDFIQHSIEDAAKDCELAQYY